MTSRLESLELKIATLLRVGVFISGSLLLGSVLLSGIQPEWALLLAKYGLSLLVSLPVLRVLLTALIFFYEKEFTMFIVASCVLLLLSLSFTLGWGGH